MLKNKSIYFFGAGNRGIEVLNILIEMGVSPKAFIDNDKNKHGSNIKGVTCIYLDDLPNDNNNTLVVISPISSESIIAEVERLKIDWLLYEDIFHAKYYYPAIIRKGDFYNARPFNWYESPYPDLKRIHEDIGTVPTSRALAIDFNIDRQIRLIHEFAIFGFPSWSDDKDVENRYYYKNGMFGKGSADILYYFMWYLRPRHIIEIRSGFSTAAMLEIPMRSIILTQLILPVLNRIQKDCSLF